MKQKIKIIIAVSLLLFSGVAHSDSFKTEEEMRIFSDTFIEQMVKAEFQKGFDSAKVYWPLPTVEIDGIVNQINQQWPMVSQRFGKPTGKEFVKEERVGASFLRYYYLHKFDIHAIYWKIDFYKAKDQWKINTIRFLDNLDALYE